MEDVSAAVSAVAHTEVTAEVPRQAEVLTPTALRLIELLHSQLEMRRRELLEARLKRQEAVARGEDLHFLPETAHIRQGAWQVAPPSPGLVDRRVEITGPTTRQMTVNALNSGARVWLADFEDANTPTWANMIDGQVNLVDACRRSIDFVGDNGKEYRLRPNDELATVIVRPRGLHLTEKHVTIEGQRVAGALFDFAVYMANCAQLMIDAGRGPYFYLPKLESHLEARWWNDAFVLAQDLLGIPLGTIRATVLVETFPAAFEMEEILYELRDHSAGLNAGRWDFMFSAIKFYRDRGSDYVLPDRNAVTMTVPFMRAYTELLVKTCHTRGAHAIGGMSAFIPSRDVDVNARAIEKVAEDKRREASDGFDGSWVAHPDLVAVCRSAFDAVLEERPHQLDRLRSEVEVEAEMLLDVRSTPGDITEAGLRANISVAVQYLQAWLGGRGAVAIFNLMEDAATAEICRSQVWQWVRAGSRLDTGELVTAEFVRSLADEEIAKLDQDVDYSSARELFETVALGSEFIDFLTVPSYETMP